MNDWIDSTLRARPVDDDGFADRVITIGQAHDRTRRLLRGVVALALASALVAAGARVIEEVERFTYEALGYGESWQVRKDLWKQGAAREEAFVRDWRRLAERPEWRRVADGPAADAQLAPLAVNWAAYFKANADVSLDEDIVELLTAAKWARQCDADPSLLWCDTSALVGLHRFARLEQAPNFPVGMFLRRHLRRAARVDGATFSAAVTDVHAFLRFNMAHAPGWLFDDVRQEIEAARKAGLDTGGAQALLSVEDARRFTELWVESDVFMGVQAQPSTRAMIADSQSLVACGARNDLTGGLDLAIALADDPALVAVLRRVGDDSDGCAPRQRWTRGRTCDGAVAGIEKTACDAFGSVLFLPGIRQLLLPLLSPPPWSWP